MRLQPAIPLDELTDFGALVPVRRIVRGATGGGRRRKRGRERGTLTRKARPEAADARDPRDGRRRGGAFLDALPGLVNRVIDGFEDEDDDDLDDELEGLRRRRRSSVSPGEHNYRGSSLDRRADRAWSEAIPMGARLRLQAQRGHRAAVMELRPGLFLVAEVPEEATRPEMGMAPMLAPMMARAARDALEGVPRGRGPLGALFRHPQPGTRVVRVQAQPTPTRRPLLPGPVADGDVLVPDVGWASDEDAVEALGCAGGCARCGR